MKLKFTLAFLLSSSFVFAQDSSFQIKDYKYRTPGYKALAFSVNLSGGYGEVKMPNQESNTRSFELEPL
ncbi:MAG TPA: hypothetical protein VFL47_09605, partial [Flavisolibacter sp.]|nr:hypothetical protein [Flavisolibacter sp.]